MSQQPGNAPSNEVNEEARQENAGRTNMAGSGEWPSPSESPPTGPTAGERGPTHLPPERGTASQPDQLQDARSGVGSPGAARLSETDAESPTEDFKDVLEQDPVHGGSSSVGDPEGDTWMDDAGRAD